MKTNCSSGPSRCIAKCFKIAVKVAAGIAALGVVVMWLWNWLMPALFTGAHEVGYLQALGILVLSKILFGGIRGCGHRRKAKRRRHWEQMSPEERAQLKEQFTSRWGHWCGATKKDDSPGKDAPPPAA